MRPASITIRLLVYAEDRRPYFAVCAIRQMLGFYSQDVFRPTDITRRCATV
jgi:hypothetical protein